MINIKTTGYSFIGRRKNNEDNYSIFHPNKKTCLVLVADGMGGTEGGEIASKLVIDKAEKIITEHCSQDKISSKNLKQIIEEIFSEAQKVVASKINESQELMGMGTTLCCILIYENAYVWGNLGDCRIYFLSNGSINQITEDHTFIQAFINEHGYPIPKYIQDKSNLITRSINGGSDKPDIFPLGNEFEELAEGELFLLCSDGLITDKSAIDNSIFSDYIFGGENIDKSAKYLISNAFHEGSTDNITVVIVLNGVYKRKKIRIKKWHYPPLEKKKISPKLLKRKKNRLFILSSFLLISILAVLFFTFKGRVKEMKMKKQLPVQSEADSLVKNTNNTENNYNVDWQPFSLDDNKVFNIKEIIGWEPYDGPDIIHYKIILHGKSIEFSDITERNEYRFSDLEGIKPGIYSVEISAMVNGNLIIGNTLDNVKLK